MGTRADFYVNRGKEKAEWIGSIGWDGYPNGIDSMVLEATTEKGFRNIVKDFLDNREDATYPQDGWPWPWKDSRTTDYTYAFDSGKVYASYFGNAWFDPLIGEPETEENIEIDDFPDMTAKQNVAWDKRSGIIVIGT